MRKFIFDDVVTDDYGAWTQVCKECSEKYSFLGRLKEIPIALFCGVSDCCNEAEYYLDFKERDFCNEE